MSRQGASGPYENALSCYPSSVGRAKLQTLVEGIDYYLEGTKFVFTAEYHLKRGYCCNSRCRHCPYDRKSGPAVSMEFVGMTLKRPASRG